jgi:predicted Zn finger-like uncharacterized protein
MKENCPHCNAENYACVDDPTLPDFDAIKCWNCNHTFWIEDMEDCAKVLGMSFEESYVAQGKQRVSG